VKNKFTTLLLLVIIFSSVIRLLFLTQSPEGFDATEAAFAYNAFSLLKTGHDEDGKPWPLVLTSIGDYKLVGYSIWQIPFIAVFGLNEFAARLSTAISAVISLLLIYYIVNSLFKNRKLALLTVFITSITPGHLILSRMAYDPMIALMWILASIALFIRWHKTNYWYLLVASGFALSWATATYYAVWVLLPFILILYSFHLYKKIAGQSKLFSFALLLFLPVVTFGYLFTTTRGERLGQDSTFQVHAQPLLEEQIREDQHAFPFVVTRLFHNKLVFYPQQLLKNLFTNLSFDLLFLNGDKIDRRFWVPYQGVLLLWSAPFLLLGLLYFWKYHLVYKNLLLLGGIGLTFLGSSFSEFGSETERTLFAAPLFALLVSYGLLVLFDRAKRYPLFVSATFLMLLALLLGVNSAYFNHQYFWHANIHEPWGRNYGMREMLSLLPEFASKYRKIVIPDSAYIFYYFYNNVAPEQAQQEAKLRLSQGNFLGLKLRKQVGEYLTTPINCPTNGQVNVLYVCQGRQIPRNSKIIKIIRFRDEQPAFILLEFTPAASPEELPKFVSFMDSSGLISEGSENYW